MSLDFGEKSVLEMSFQGPSLNKWHLGNQLGKIKKNTSLSWEKTLTIEDWVGEESAKETAKDWPMSVSVTGAKRSYCFELKRVIKSGKCC